MARRLQILARLGFRIHPKGIQIINEESFKLLRKNMHKFFRKKIPIYSVECPYLLSKRDAKDRFEEIANNKSNKLKDKFCDGER